MNGEKGVVTPTFVKSPLYEDQGVEYFSSNVELGVSFGWRPWGVSVLGSGMLTGSRIFAYRLLVLRRFTELVRSLPRRRSSSPLVFPSKCFLDRCEISRYLLLTCAVVPSCSYSLKKNIAKGIEFVKSSP